MKDAALQDSLVKQQADLVGEAFFIGHVGRKVCYWIAIVRVIF
jgi:hypothetical protein